MVRVSACSAFGDEWWNDCCYGCTFGSVWSSSCLYCDYAGVCSSSDSTTDCLSSSWACFCYDCSFSLSFCLLYLYCCFLFI